MHYNLVITDRAEELIDEHLNHLVHRLKNEQAARHLLDGIEKLYDRLEDNPFQFTDCRDSFLRSKGFKEALRGFSAAALLQMKGLFESLSVLKTYPLHMTWESLNGPAPAPPVI